MKRFKGTSGPWVLSYRGDICIGISKKHQAGYSQLIVNTVLPETVEDYKRERTEIESNARLIAAAPEMLEALLLFQEIDKRENEDWRPKEKMAAIIGLKKMIQDCITKALGEE